MVPLYDPQGTDFRCTISAKVKSSGGTVLCSYRAADGESFLQVWLLELNYRRYSSFVNRTPAPIIGVFLLIIIYMQNSIDVMRHSCAHLIAAAAAELFPGAKFGIGPVVENGFYYDIDFPQNITEEDLAKIENKAQELIKKNLNFVRKEMDLDAAIKYFADRGQEYKVMLLNDIKNKGTTKINAEEMQEVDADNGIVSVYETGNFVDLCRGPHVETTKEIGVFKLTKLAGAYWRGDANNKQLQRIYGVCFETKKELDEYLHMVEEAEKRDHRRLGKELDLFMNHEYAPGMPFFLPKGMVVLQELTKFVREFSYGEGYSEVRTPQLLNAELWKTSGHWEHYQQDMFCMHHAEDNIDMGLKPMNCPAHMLVFKRDIHSYKELPLRLAEVTTLYRNEKSGTLHGLTRVRSLSQDDTHIFARPDQIMGEIAAILEKIKKIYTIFNLQIDEIHLSTRPDKFLGEESVWNQAENDLKTALQDAGLKYHINAGDGAFYGPKIDVKVKDAIGRQWQLATIQLDFQMPQRFGLTYVDSDGTQKTPVVVHRAILGTMERFLGIIIEHFSGALPVWLSPVQVMLAAVSAKHTEGAHKIATELSNAGIRVEVDDADETLGNKIRKSAGRKIPYLIVVGDKELSGEDWMILYPPPR